MKLVTPSKLWRPSRRDVLKTSAGALLSFAIPTGNNAPRDPQFITANGGTDPYPIPWLDKNGSHNQPAGSGNRIAFGSPTTDYGVMQGEYWAAREPQQGTFTHI